MSGSQGRYLRAFETGRLPESTCTHRLTKLDHEVEGLEVRAAALEAECDTTPTMTTDHLLAGVRQLLIEAPVGLDEDQVVLRRIDVEVGYTVIEVKKTCALAGSVPRR